MKKTEEDEELEGRRKPLICTYMYTQVRDSVLSAFQCGFRNGAQLGGGWAAGIVFCTNLHMKVMHRSLLSYHMLLLGLHLRSHKLKLNSL